MEDLRIEYWPIERLTPYAKNSRTHSRAQIEELKVSFKTFGMINPALIDVNGELIAGHGRIMAATELGVDKFPVIVLKHLSESEKRAYVIADNKLASKGGWDLEILAQEIGELSELDFDVSIMGFDDKEIEGLLANSNFLPDDDEEEAKKKLLASLPGKNKETEPKKGRKGAGSLAERFLLPPFTVLNAREGWWRDRKNAWLALGILPELGREAVTNLGKEGDSVEENDQNGSKKSDVVISTVSVFDPVLCELAYKWFCRSGWASLDLFAGGSVRGVVASKLGIHYTGVDLSSKQVESNRIQADEICDVEIMPEYVVGDSADVEELAPGTYDFIFTCPPYADLEVYSEDDADLSNMGYAAFLETYRHIIASGVRMLRNDRFAAVLVGDVRDKKTGIYHGFIRDTINAFEAAGMELYNEAILITVVGSLSLRAARQFTHSRKLGKTHQNLLVFVKGDPKRATEALGNVEVDDVLDEVDTEES